MSAFLALDAARAAGIEVRLNGKDLDLSADSEPPPDVLDMLRRHKLSIVALLQRPLVPRPSLQPSQPWDRDDWRAFFDERAAIAEFDGGLPGPDAEALAFDCSVAEWLYRNPVTSVPGLCPICRDADRPNDPLLPVGTAGAGEVWLHRGCSAGWCTARKAEAVADLAAMGIEARVAGAARSCATSTPVVEIHNEQAKGGSDAER
jgi:hypothetical protein